MLKGTDGGPWTTYAGPGGPTAYVDSPAVLPDGRLLIDVVAWSDQRAARPAHRPIGLYAGTLWSAPAPAPVGMGAPFDTSRYRSMMNILDLAVTPRTVTTYARTAEQTGVVASSDDGRTWTPVRVR
ncbi:MAG TPA: hypothetical protein VFI21_07840 [Nocardioides sp.]|jgi:hypothetical protein|nr:hypothetical protein [Nocardioides sp.]